MNSKKEVYTKEQRDLLITILDLTMRRKIGDDKTEELIKKLNMKGDDNMLAVLDMIDRENKQIFEKGKREGKRCGEILGIKKGKLETAKKMLEEKIDIETILRITGLTREEIMKVK